MLLISPVLTRYVQGYDIVVYVSVLYGFAFLFIYRSRQVIARWNTWLLDVPSVSDQEVLDWYTDTFHDGDRNALSHLTAPAAMDLSRCALYAAVCKAKANPVRVKAGTDETVAKLARAYPTTVFLLDWYSRYMRASKPMPYTSTWNLQIKVALNTLRSFDKGLRLHNGFIHWRHASAEIACGMLYFFLALLDRWIELFCGGTLIGLQILVDNQSRIAVGLGLGYYLFGAVILDIKASPLYEAVKRVSQDRLHSAEHLTHVAKQDLRNKQKLYWGTLLEFQLIQIWGIVFTSAYISVYVADETAVLLYFSYIIAYTGLLWFQYNRVFAGREAIVPIIIALSLGLAVGIPLRLIRPDLFWNDVLSLGLATWTAGILTFMRAKIGAPPIGKSDEHVAFAHSQKAIGPNNTNDHDRLDALFDTLSNLPKSGRLAIKRPNTIASEVLRILTDAKHSPKAHEIRSAFPNAFQLLDQVLVSWDSGETIVEGVSLDLMTGKGFDVRAVSRKVDRELRIFVGMELRDGNWMSNFLINCRTHDLSSSI